MEEDELDFVLVMIGDAGVGKTSILLRFAEEQFMDSYVSTVGVDFRYRKFTVGDKQVKLQIWDTAGQERFRTMTASYYRNADGVILVYDITSQRSFEHAGDWLRSVDQHAPEGVVRLMVGNKCDLEDDREVDGADAKQYAKEAGMLFTEASAKSAKNVDKAYEAIALELMKKAKKKKRVAGDSKTSKVVLSAGKKRGKCCK